MLTTLSTIASTQAEPTEETMDNIKLFLDYAASHQDTILTYQTSDMVLILHSNAFYPKSRRRPLFHVIQRHKPTQQWHCPQHCPAHQSSNVFSSRS
jgi:hypothetical protein